MNKEQQELLDEAYKNYVKHWEPNIEYIDSKPILTQEEFINKCKCNIEFSQRWGLKIEERELFKLERINVAIEKKLTHKTAHLTKDFDYQKWCDEQNIPTKLITITYNDKTIESYE
jgi:hypothetical protein